MDKFFAYSDRAELNKLPVRHEEIKRRWGRSSNLKILTVIFLSGALIDYIR
jgi:hypothetical protein